MKSGLYAITAAALWLAAGAAQAAPPPADPALAMIKKYVASYDHDAFLADRQIAPQLAKLMGPRLATVKSYLSVSGPVEYIGGSLSVSGNAIHAGLEKMTVVCVNPYGSDNKPAIEVAIAESGKISVFTTQPRYDFTSQCIKDWVGLVNTRFAARMNQPSNVLLVMIK